MSSVPAQASAGGGALLHHSRQQLALEGLLLLELAPPASRR